MYVVIIGGGEIGSFVARVLIEEQHEVVVVEQNDDLVPRLQGTLDAIVIEGSGVSPPILRRAGIDRADLFLALTSSDEVNLVSCMIARRHGRTGLKTVARVKQSHYVKNDEIFSVDDLDAVDALVHSEQAIATTAVEMLRYAGSGELRELAGGRLVLVGMVLGSDSPLIADTLAAIRVDLPRDCLVVAVQDREGVRIPTGADRLRSDERAYFLTLPGNLTELTILSGQPWYRANRILLVGIGNTGFALAHELLAKGFTPTLMEKDFDRAEWVASRISRAITLHGDASDPELLRRTIEEQHIDAVVVLLNDSERSLLLGIFAKSLGARKVIVRCDQPAYAHLAHKLGIDAIISKKRAVANAVLRYVSRGQIESTLMLGEHDVEVIDFRVAASPNHPELTVEPLKNLGFPDGALVGAVVRNGTAFIASGDTVLQAGDELLVVCKPDAIARVEAVLS